MRFAVLLLCTVASAEGWSQQPVDTRASLMKVGVLGIRGYAVQPEQLAALSSQYAKALAERGAVVATREQLAAALGADRDIIDCDELVDCREQVVERLNVDVLARGAVAFVDAAYRINLELIDARTGRVLSASSARATTSEELSDQLSRAAFSMAPIAARKVDKTLRSNPRFERQPVPPPLITHRSNAVAWTCLLTGGAALLGGGALLALSWAPSDSQRNSQLLRGVGYPLLITGAGLVATGVVLYEGEGAQLSASLMPLPHGAAAAFTAVFP